MTTTEINPCRICGKQPVISETPDHTFNVTCDHADIVDWGNVYIFDRPTREQVIIDWNKENPLIKRTWYVSAKKQAELERWYDKIRSILYLYRDDYAEKLCVNNRIKIVHERIAQLDAMSYDELMNIIEADTVLLFDPDIKPMSPEVEATLETEARKNIGCQQNGALTDDEYKRYLTELNRLCAGRRFVRLRTLIERMRPEMFANMPAYIRARADQLINMSDSQFKEEVEADFALFL